MLRADVDATGHSRALDVLRTDEHKQLQKEAAIVEGDV